MVKLYRSPGPKYDAPTGIGYDQTNPMLIRAPAFSLGQQLQGRETLLRTPGPKYDLSDVTHRGPVKQNGALLTSRRRDRVRATPGPAAYNIVPCVPVTMPSMPMYSIGMKRTVRKKPHPSPAANAYLLAPTIGNQVPDMPSMPMYTISGRSAEPGRGGGRRSGTLYGSPGPARYSAVQLELFKAQTPRPVMLSRNDPRSLGKRTPAPNAYFPGPGSRHASAPQFSMAGRYPERADPYLTAADRVPDWEQ